tara:strand:+ start:111963 stop:112253 length:291 start_codon:yes stop_codon:yes gene_type:complete
MVRRYDQPTILRECKSISVDITEPTAAKRDVSDIANPHLIDPSRPRIRIEQIVIEAKAMAAFCCSRLKRFGLDGHQTLRFQQSGDPGHTTKHVPAF